MRLLRWLLPAAFATMAALAAAETPSQPAADASKAAAAPKKADARKADAKKAAPPAKKKEPKKSEPKKSPPKKTDAKKAAPSKPEHMAPGITRYSNSKDAPVLRDAQGNVIPSSPDAYDVSSATGGKKK